jgi:energy-coupling factor transporter ATP-binding protein EcfA2
VLAIKDVVDANALAPSQTLPFTGTGLTIIYGDNGAGKSGYVRILKHACRARYPGKIHGNIYSASPRGPASATIEYAVGGVAQTAANWRDASPPDATLSAISVFDSECAAVHIGSKNEVAFRPFGLDVPDELASACQRVKDTLTEEQAKLQNDRHPIFQKPTWNASTAVGRRLSSLRLDTDETALTKLATFTEEERKRHAQLKDALSKDLTKAAAEQKAKAENIKAAIDAITRIEAHTGDDPLNQMLVLGIDASTKKEAGKVAAEDAFSGERLPGVGADAWRVLWDAAKRYSMEAAYPRLVFPVTGDDALCVLCQQPLEDTAKDRLRRFEKFTQDDTARLAKDAEIAASAAIRKLKALTLQFRAIAPSIREIALHDPALAKQFRRFYAASRLRRCLLLRAIEDGESEPWLPAAVAPALAEIETQFRQYADELRKSANDEERKKLESELTELDDRATLAVVMPVVKQEIARLKDLEFIDRCMEETATNNITKLGNDIADSVITPQLRDRFQQEIVKLAAERVRVEIVRSGGKFGSPQYEVRFFAKPGAKVADVLSEGERTCVALATFLTELATAQHASALIFDDPVSSLDHRWRKQVAKRLAEEAAHRQIIVFTHDLIFVNDLLGFVKGTAQYLTVSKEEIGAGVVEDGLPWKAKSVEDRLDKLEKDARDAKVLYNSNAQARYASVAVSVYNHLRATWERAIEEIAFSQVVRRHRDYIDTKHLRKATVLTEADCDSFYEGFKKCCDVTDAHDPSIGRNAEPPPATELLDDVQALKDWVKSLRDRQKAFN